MRSVAGRRCREVLPQLSISRSHDGDTVTEVEDNTGDSGQPLTNTSVTFPEGRATLEYWGQWTNGLQQGHGLSNVLVDKTNPTVAVQRPDGESIFVITRRETVDVRAADALSGLVQDPSATGIPVNTGRRGAARGRTSGPGSCAACSNRRCSGH